MLVINIATQPIKTEFTIQNASLEMNTTPSQMQISHEASRLEISQSKGELQIDSTQCRYAYGIKTMEALCRDAAQEGMSAAIEAIGQIVADGNRLAHIESGENAVAEMAADTNISAPRQLAFISIPLPEISYKAHSPQINFTDSRLNIDFQKGNVENNFKPGKMEMHVTRYPSMKFWTSEDKVDLLV